MITICRPQEIRTLLAGSGRFQFIDVREFPEYASVHVPGVQLLPLAQLKDRMGELDPAMPVVVICKSGKRAEKAAQILDAHGFKQVTIVEGGTDAWVAAGLPVERSEKAPWALERQVRLSAGVLVLLGLFIPPWPWLSAFVGAGLVFAGITNTCGMAMLLARMPWNRSKGVPAQKCSCK